MIKMEEKEMKKKTINEKLARVEQDRKMKLCIVRKMCSEGAKKNLLGLNGIENRGFESQSQVL